MTRRPILNNDTYVLELFGNLKGKIGWKFYLAANGSLLTTSSHPQKYCVGNLGIVGSGDAIKISNAPFSDTDFFNSFNLVELLTDESKRCRFENILKEGRCTLIDKVIRRS